MIDLEERKKRASNYFREGYNCSQSVLMAYSDLYDMDIDIAKKISASFGAGFGRMRELCGAISGTAIVVGLQYPVEDPKDNLAKKENYAAVQRCTKAFKDKFGTIYCRDLLAGISKDTNPTPSERTEEYYAVRPCERFVIEAADILGRELLKSL